MQSCFSFFSARLGWLGFLAWIWLAVVPAPATEEDSLIKAMAGLLDAMHEARFDDVIDQVQGDPQLRQHERAGYLLGMALECQGRDEEALEVYTEIVDGWPDELWPDFYGRRATDPMSLPNLGWQWIDSSHNFRSIILGRMAGISAEHGEQAWQNLTDRFPEHLRKPPSFQDWRQVGHASSMSVEDRLKRHPSNESAARGIGGDRDWEDVAHYLMQRHPDRSVASEAYLRCQVIRHSENPAPHVEALASWLESRDEDDLHSLGSYQTGTILLTMAAYPEAAHRVVEKSLFPNLNPDQQAEALMFLAHRYLLAGDREAEGIALANRAVALWREASPSPDQQPIARGTRWTRMKKWLRRPLDDSDSRVDTRWHHEWRRPFYETLPPSAFHLAFDPVSIQDAAALESPMLRRLVSRREDGGQDLLLQELATAGKGTDVAMLRDLRRLLWVSAPKEGGDEWTRAKENCEEAARQADDRLFALEAEVTLDLGLWGKIRHSFDRNVSITAPKIRYEELQKMADDLMAQYPEERAITDNMLWYFMSQVHNRRHGEFWKQVRTVTTHQSTVINRDFWLERGAQGLGEGLSDLVARLWHLDAQTPGGESLELVRRIHASFPHRRFWAMELALRVPDESEAFALLDAHFSEDEDERRAWLLHTTFLRRQENPWSAEAKEAAALRLARWDQSRHPQGTRRWLREAIPVLVDFTPGHEAWELLFDGSGSAEGAYDRMLELGEGKELGEEVRLDLARRVLLSGAYADDETPWIDRARFFGRKVLPRPHSRRGKAKALPDLLEAADRLGAEVVFPEGFIKALQQVDSVTATWLEAVLRGEIPPARFATEGEWFCIGQGPNHKKLPKGYRPPDPGFAVLKFGIPWHERARYEATLSR